MEKGRKYTDKQVAMEKLQAFALFHKDGLTAVKQSYPEHLQFVREHKTKTYGDVKKELFSTVGQG